MIQSGYTWRNSWASMRATPRRLVKTLFLVSMIGFLIVNMNLFLETRPYPPEEEHHDSGINTYPQQPKEINLGAIKDIIKKSNTSDHMKNVGNVFVDTPKSNNISHYNRSNSQNYTNYDRVTFKFDEFISLGNDHEAIKAYIKQANKAQKIRNLDKFDLPSSQNGIVIVVQVHDRSEYLKHVIETFREAKYIEQSLLVFSHDYFSDDINKLIYQIDFCPVLQIFYPVPIQLYPHEFPGEDPHDCPRDSNKAQAAKMNCLNAEWPDKYGHYREARYTQTKHHWYWKVNHVFDHLEVTKKFNGPILFSEDDHLVSVDFIHTLQKMYRFRESSCKDCNILTLGTYLKAPVYGAYSKKGFWQRLFGNDEGEPKRDGVEIMNWISSKHNMGMAFDREVWMKIKHCAETFCKFDDYNWDWSLQFVSMNCIQNKLKVMVMKSPRIFHIGECGMHKKGKVCDPAQSVANVKTLLNNNKQFLFPDSLEIQGYPRTPTKMPKPNGGWGDKRDHELCLHFAHNPDLHR